MRAHLRATRVTSVAAALALAACGAPTVPPEQTDTEPEWPARVETLWTGPHEWFVEHPLLVVGEVAEIAAHLTTLADFRPVETGRLEVTLTDASGSEQLRVVEEAVARSGIFIPEITPVRPGVGHLRFRYTSEAGAVDEVGWDVRVAATFADLGEAPPEAEGIGFLKEQQWRIPFATVSVSTAPMRRTLELPAVIESHPRATAVVAAPASGTFHAPEGGLVSSGSSVERDQILGRLMPLPDAVSDWNELPARLVEARNRVIEAEREHDRTGRLVEAGAVPARRLHEAELELENARAALQAVEARAARVDLEALGGAGLAVRAPLTGTIAEVGVTDGEPVDPARSLFRILDLGRLVARVEVPEPELQELLAARERGIRPTLALRPAGDAIAGSSRAWILDGRLLELGTTVDPLSRTAAVRYEVRGAADRLRPGMSAIAQLGLGESREVLAVPASAILDLAGVPVVYVQLGGETFEERAVRTGTRDGDRIEILSGVTAGDRVVTVGAYQVRLAALSPDAAPAHSH